MESSKNSTNIQDTSRQTLLPPISPLPRVKSYADHCPVVVGSQGGISNPFEGQKSQNHQRCSSESFVLEDQPSWLEDLLNEPEVVPVHRGHRRSASDSFTYSAKTFSTWDKNKNKQKVSQSFAHNNKDSSTAFERNGQVECGSQNRGGSGERNDCSQTKPSMSKTDAKRANQQSAHRSRVRKLQYISELERNIQWLQFEGSEVSAELEFLDQQSLILGMENRALRQRLDSLSQEQLIKQMEQDMLEQEIGRLQTLYQLQLQQQQQQQQHQQHSKHH